MKPASKNSLRRGVSFGDFVLFLIVFAVALIMVYSFASGENGPLAQESEQSGAVEDSTR